MKVAWVVLLAAAALAVASGEGVIDFMPAKCLIGATDRESGASEWTYSKSSKCVALKIAADAHSRYVARLPDYVKANRMIAVIAMYTNYEAQRVASSLKALAITLGAQASVDISSSKFVAVDVDSCASSGRCSADWRLWTPELRYDAQCTDWATPFWATPFYHIDTPKCQRLKNECERASSEDNDATPEGQRLAWFKADCFETVELGGAAAEIRYVSTPWCNALRSVADNAPELLRELDASLRELDAAHLRLQEVTAAAAP